MASEEATSPYICRRLDEDDFLNFYAQTFRMIVDVRAPSRFNQGHIYSAVNFTQGLLEVLGYIRYEADDNFADFVVLYDETPNTPRIKELLNFLDHNAFSAGLTKTITLGVLNVDLRSLFSKYPFLDSQFVGDDADAEERRYPSVVIPGFLYLGGEVSAMDPLRYRSSCST